eukprot:tig00020510_g9893.t1
MLALPGWRAPLLSRALGLRSLPAGIRLGPAVVPLAPRLAQEPLRLYRTRYSRPPKDHSDRLGIDWFGARSSGTANAAAEAARREAEEEHDEHDERAGDPAAQQPAEDEESPAPPPLKSQRILREKKTRQGFVRTAAKLIEMHKAGASDAELRAAILETQQSGRNAEDYRSAC